jgi:hypothetical protein
LGGAGEPTKLADIVITIHRWTEVHATSRNVILGGLLWLASAGGVIALQAQVTSQSGGLSVPDVVPLYGPRQLFETLERYGDAGRRAFLRFTLYDLFYPLVAYGFALLLLASLLRSFTKAHPRWSYLVLLPFGGLAVELLEQAGFLVSLLVFPQRPLALGWALSVLSAGKLFLLGLLVVGLCMLMAAAAAARVRRPTRRCS